MIPCQDPSASGVKNHRTAASASRCPRCSPPSKGVSQSQPSSLSSRPTSASASKPLMGAARMLNDLDQGRDAQGPLGSGFGVTIKPSGEYEVYTNDGTHRIEPAPEGARVHLKPRNANVLRTPSEPSFYQVKKELDPRYVHMPSEMADQSHRVVDATMHEGLNNLMRDLEDAKGDPETQVAAFEAARDRIREAKERERSTSVKQMGTIGLTTEVGVDVDDSREGAERLYSTMMDDISGTTIKRPDYRSPFRRGWYVSDNTKLHLRGSGGRPIEIFTAIDDGDQHFTMMLKDRQGNVEHTASFASSGTREEAVEAIHQMMKWSRDE